MNQKHFKKIINGYHSAPINKIFNPTMELSLGRCKIKMKVLKDFHHSANSLHGSIYFKMLDDAAWGAANTYIEDVFLFTYNFNLYLTKPVSRGLITSKAKVVERKDGKIISESVLYDYKNNEIGRGSGTFMRSKYLLKDAIGFFQKKEK